LAQSTLEYGDVGAVSTELGVLNRHSSAGAVENRRGRATVASSRPIRSHIDETLDFASNAAAKGPFPQAID
jgi:hypothetical protein